MGTRPGARAGTRWAGRGALAAVACAVAALVMVSLPGCARCGDDREPPVMPRVEREGSGLLGPPVRGVGGAGAGEEPRAQVAGPRHPGRDETDGPGTTDDDAAIAQVNGVTVPRSRLEARLQRRMELSRGNREERGPVWRNRERRRIARELVEEEMLGQHLSERGITIGDDELAAAMEDEIARLFHAEEHFERYLRRRNLSREEWASRLRFELALGRLMRERGRVTATEEEVRQYYERFRENWRAAERVRVSTIALRLPRDPRSEVLDATRERLTALRAEAGADLGRFEELAREHSQSPDRYRGGDLGWVYRDDRELDPAVAQVLFGLEVGTVSEPVRTPLGMQIFYVRDHRAEGYRDFDEVRDSLNDIVEQRAEQALRLSLTHELEQRYEVSYNEGAFGLEPE
jgi:parvulin-like peptidyl-prolyl isomerase